MNAKKILVMGALIGASGVAQAWVEPAPLYDAYFVPPFVQAERDYTEAWHNQILEQEKAAMDAQHQALDQYRTQEREQRDAARNTLHPERAAYRHYADWRKTALEYQQPYPFRELQAQHDQEAAVLKAQREALQAAQKQMAEQQKATFAAYRPPYVRDREALRASSLEARQKRVAELQKQIAEQQKQFAEQQKAAFEAQQQAAAAWQKQVAEQNQAAFSAQQQAAADYSKRLQEQWQSVLEARRQAQTATTHSPVVTP